MVYCCFISYIYILHSLYPSRDHLVTTIIQKTIKQRSISPDRTDELFRTQWKHWKFNQKWRLKFLNNRKGVVELSLPPVSGRMCLIRRVGITGSWIENKLLKNWRSTVPKKGKRFFRSVCPHDLRFRISYWNNQSPRNQGAWPPTFCKEKV